MASINRRRDKWRVQVRRHGHHLSKTFAIKADAEKWAREAERSIDLDIDPRTPRISGANTFSSLVAMHIENLRRVWRLISLMCLSADPFGPVLCLVL